ncbi:MAG: class I SAM-dependent methyltransferase [Thermoleophilia bacterium]|nr:class I SAM-dependent methyltransferase [Thermoleophilia bacterium]
MDERFDVPADWYDGFFEGDWLEVVALAISDERTQQQADFLVERLALEPGARVLDLACGHGRVTLELARRGYRATGLDLSARSLAVARGAAEGEGLEVDLIEADMRELPPTGDFDAVVNLFTAFGYFEDERENERVLEGVARALRPGGAFLIDTVSLLGLMGRYRDRMWEVQEGGVLFLQEHRFDVLRGRNEARWTFVHPDGRRSEIVHSVRAYAPHELAAMLERAGLPVEAAWGSFDGSELTRESWRTILLARKPA